MDYIQDQPQELSRLEDETIEQYLIRIATMKEQK
jgi:hypothetical protein